MLYFREERHLGTQIEIQIVSEDSHTDTLMDYMFVYCADFEAEFSRFLPSSPLSELNRTKSLTVSHRFIDLLSLSLTLMDETGGRFSPFVDIASLGYSADYDTGVFEKSTSIHGGVGSAVIQGNAVILGDDTTLDFGGIGKGYLVDRLREILAERGEHNYCINAGGDLFVSGKNSEELPWVVGIENPKRADTYASITASDRAITTSGSYRRRWSIDSRSYHHILDASTHTNLDTYLSVTLIGVSVARTDALTKAIWHTPILDLESAFARYEIEGVVIATDGMVFVSPGCASQYHFHIFS